MKYLRWLRRRFERLITRVQERLEGPDSDKDLALPIVIIVLAVVYFVCQIIQWMCSS